MGNPNSIRARRRRYGQLRANGRRVDAMQPRIIDEYANFATSFDAIIEYPRARLTTAMGVPASMLGTGVAPNVTEVLGVFDNEAHTVLGYRP